MVFGAHPPNSESPAWVCAQGVWAGDGEEGTRAGVSGICAVAVTSSRAPAHSCTWLSADSVDSSGLRRDEFGRP